MIFALAISQSSLSMPELLWKAHINFEIEEGDQRRQGYSTSAWSACHKVWISYTEFEGSSIPVPRALREEDSGGDTSNVRVV